MTAYQLASLADDIDYDINLIIRGEDLLKEYRCATLSRLAHRCRRFHGSYFLSSSLWSADEKGEKLSKSSGSPSLKAMRDSGVTTEQYIPG